MYQSGDLKQFTYSLTRKKLTSPKIVELVTPDGNITKVSYKYETVARST